MRVSIFILFSLVFLAASPAFGLEIENAEKMPYPLLPASTWKFHKALYHGGYYLLG